MADVDRRNGGHRGGLHNRKRRYRDEDEYDRRPQRRRHEEPTLFKLRRQMLNLAENSSRKVEDDIQGISKLAVDNYNDEDTREAFLNLTLQLAYEQPFKIPFVASIFIVANNDKPILTEDLLKRVASATQQHLRNGAWREVKLSLRLLAILQGLLEGDGVFLILQELFSRAVDLQTASSEDALGLELVKIIQLTVAYAMASSATALEAQASALLEKTDIIASTPHTLDNLVDAYPGSDEVNSHEPRSVIALLQRQLQNESENSWKLECIPRPWKALLPLDLEVTGSKHTLPSIEVPSPTVSKVRPRLPELYFSVYLEQDVETVPPDTNIASCVLRDVLVDTINILDFNRNIAAKFLIELDCFFPPKTFVKRGTPFDKLRDQAEGQSTWKPEDIVVDAVFSQLLQLPAPEHKLVYYHSVLTEACKIAPAAVAPSLGRAIRYLYKSLETMDLELQYRFMDWFSHHLSNFGFTWKWIEWVDDVELSNARPHKAFILGALEKEVRLSVVQRIRGTLPEPYQRLLPSSDEDDAPPFKYSDDRTPYAQQGREILRLIRTKASDSEIQAQIRAIQDLAIDKEATDPLVPSTDAYVTCVCFAGSKSLSHTLSYIERCKDRLLAIGPASSAARRQIVGSVMEYWSEKPGVGVNIVDKLLNYTILTPMSVVEWALVDKLERGKVLTHAHIYEMIASTTYKVTNRVRQIVAARNQAGLPTTQIALLEETLAKERSQMIELLTVIEDALRGIAEGSADAMAESQDQDEEGEALLRSWGWRWLRVFRRKMAVEQAWIQEMLANPMREARQQNANENEQTAAEEKQVMDDGVE